MNEKLHDFSPEELIRAAIEFTIFEVARDHGVVLTNGQIEAIVESVYSDRDTNHLYRSIKCNRIMDSIIESIEEDDGLWGI
jgi:hypothetical protein